MEYEIEEDAHPTAEHFKQPIEQIELGKKLARYRELATEIEILEEAKERLRKELIELGKGEESITAGGYAAFFKRVKGRESFDWKRFSEDKVGKPTDEDKEKYGKTGEDSVRVEVRKL